MTLRKLLDDKYLVIAVVSLIVILFAGVLFFTYNKPFCAICDCVRFAKDCHAFCQPYGREMSTVCQHVCKRPR